MIRPLCHSLSPRLSYAPISTTAGLRVLAHGLLLLVMALALAPAVAQAQAAPAAQEPDAAAAPSQSTAPSGLRERPQSLLSPEMMAATQRHHGVQYKINVIGGQANPQRNGSNVSPYCTGPHLTYYGGPVISHAQPVAVFWNSDVNSQIVANMPQFLGDVANSTYMSVLSQYGTYGNAVGTPQTNQVIGTGSATVSGFTLVPSKCAAGSGTCTVTDADIQTELQNQISADKLPAPTYDSNGNAQTLYMTFFPPNVHVSALGSNSCVDFCAYHNTGGTIANPLIYGVMMDEYSSACRTGCGADATALENSTDVASHEFAESVTDAEIGLDTGNNYAYPGAWGDNQNSCGEIADICDSGSPGDTITVSSRSWIVQEVWSNSQGKCESSGTVTPPFNVSMSGPATTGVPFSFTVTAGNPTGYPNNGYAGTVYFYSSDHDAALPNNYTFTAGDQGVHTFSVTFQTAGSQSVTATDTTNIDLTGIGSVTVAQGQISVPNVVGDSQSAASSAITGADLAVGTVTFAPSGLYASGEVSAQIPTSGTEVNSGSSVNLTISTGPLLSPTAGSVLGGSTTFTWVGGDVSYDLTIGTTGAGSSNIFSSGPISATSATVSIPENGATLYVRLSCLGTPTVQEDYVFTEESSTTVGTATATQTATLLLNSDFTLGSIAVVTQGASDLDFQETSGGTCAVSTAYTAGQTCTVNYTFGPLRPGPRYGAVVLHDNAVPANVVATAYLQDIGNGPQAVFSPSAIGTLGGGFTGPNGVAVDAAGNVYMSDSGVNAVKEIPAGCTAAAYASDTCTVSTLGGGFNTPEGIAVDGAGNVYVADTLSVAVKEIPPGCTSSTCVKILGGGFSYVPGVAVDGSGNVYIPDYDNHLVKEMPPGCASSACVYTLGGGFAYPYGIAVDGSGNVYVTDIGSKTVLMMTPGCSSSACVTALGGGIGNPTDLAVDGSGTIYVTNTDVGKVYQMPAGCASSACVTTLGTGFAAPYGVAVDGSGNVYLANANGEVDGSGKVQLANVNGPAVNEIERVAPPGLSFASTLAGQTSTDSPQTVTVQNDGTTNLTFSALSYPKDFPEKSGVAMDCKSSSVVASGTGCSLSIDFTPQVSGVKGPSTPLSESVNFTTDSLTKTSPQSVSLSGTETSTPASLTSPAPGALPAGSKVTFKWSAAVGATGYNFRLGTTSGASNIFSSGFTTTTSATVTLPTTGEKIYASLATDYGSTQVWTYAVYSTATGAVLTSPAPGAVLAGPIVTFQWTAASGATGYNFRLGTTSGATNVFSSGFITGTSIAVSGLPTNGEKIYVSLATDYGSSQIWNDYIVTAATTAAITTPTPGSVLAGSSVTFKWTAATGANRTGYNFRVGTSPGASNVFSSGFTTATSVATTMPTNGEKLYVSLATDYGSAQIWTYYVYTAAP